MELLRLNKGMSNKKSEAPNGRNGWLKIYFMAFKRFCSDIKIKLFFEFYILYSRSKWSCLTIISSINGGKIVLNWRVDAEKVYLLYSIALTRSLSFIEMDIWSLRLVNTMYYCDAIKYTKPEFKHIPDSKLCPSLSSYLIERFALKGSNCFKRVLK